MMTKEIAEMIEAAFRRGFVHGYTLQNLPDAHKPTESELLEWRYSQTDKRLRIPFCKDWRDHKAKPLLEIAPDKI
jgi:hypothetical protein